ncbi:hypothetical protein BT67DRAFT_61205 [Trichocladium antarcticum]|uniref:Uncharacterized protein n=1 Tax=Trichocladium antarcticum TaxID=1450529 RepID=A0AAN6UI02_9PEZI|nr:hypothetical protein BT67DRAFT_61205 [Trichocladium antarcticum]
MSSVPSPAAGGSYPSQQSGTAPVVSGGAHFPPHIHKPGTPNVISFIPTTPITQSIGAGEVEKDGDSDLDSLFGDDGDDGDDGDAGFETLGAGNSMDGGNDTPPAKKIAHDHSEQPKAGCVDNQAAASGLTFPTVDPNHGGGASTQVNGANYIGTTAHEEFPKNSSTSNAVATATHATYHGMMSKLVASRMAAETSGIDTRLTPDSGKGSNPSDPTRPNASAVNSDQDDVFGVLSSGSIPKANMPSAILFGPDLQKALFTDGEAASNPQLPRSGAGANAPSDAVLQVGNGIQPGHVANTTEEEVIAPTTPQRPPATPPRLVNIAMSPPSPSPIATRGAGHNPSPDKPNTPLADRLRSGFWHLHRKEQQLLHAYRQSYRAWFEFTANAANKAQPDYAQTAATLTSHAIGAQVAWARHGQFSSTWKAENPAVVPIIHNIHEEMKLIKAGEKLRAERAELEHELRDKSDKYRAAELARYDDFVSLLKQSRERELWRGRVEAQKAAQGMIEEGLRRAAEEEEKKREKAEAEAAEKERLEQERLAAEAAEKERRVMEAAENARRAAEAAAAEKERRAMEAAENARRAAEAEAAEQERLASEAAAMERALQEALSQQAMSLDPSALAAPENTGLGDDVQDFQF